MKHKLTTLLVWVGLLGGFFLLFNLKQASVPLAYKDFQTFLEDVHAGEVKAIRFDNKEIIVTLYDTAERYRTMGTVDRTLLQTLAEHSVTVQWQKEPNLTRMFLSYGIPLVLALGVFVYLMKKRSGGMTNWWSMGKSRARLVAEPTGVTFADIGGCATAKELFRDVIDFLKNPTPWQAAGARLPRGILLEGPPGCGKTLLARAVAGETKAHFYSVAGSEFVELFVGVGAARVRDMFDTAAKNAPAIIFIDEVDAVGRRRGSGVGGTHEEREHALNQLLVCLDGFATKKPIVVLGATNRSDVLDPALLRPGRFDYVIKIPHLTAADRLEVLQIHTRNKRLGPDVHLPAWVDRTEGFSGADLERLVNDATWQAVRNVRTEREAVALVRHDDFLYAWASCQQQSQLGPPLDTVLIESASQFAEPTGTAGARIQLLGDVVLEGKILWANTTFIKVHKTSDGTAVLIPKSQIQLIEALGNADMPDRGPGRAEPWTTPPAIAA